MAKAHSGGSTSSPATNSGFQQKISRTSDGTAMAKSTLASSPPMEPSTVFFGLRMGESLCLPKSMPENSANTSLMEAQKKASTSATVITAGFFRRSRSISVR